MTVTAQLADGRVLEFPDGTDPAVIQATVKKMVAPPDMSNVTDSYSTNPTEGMSGWQRFAAGMGKGVTDVGRGIQQLSGQMTSSQVNMARLSRGLPPVEVPDAMTAEIDAAKARDAPLMNTGAGVAGDIAGTVAAGLPAMAIPGVNTYAGATALGAGMGYMQPVATDESRALNTGLGAVGGAAGQAVGNGLSRLLSPQTRASVMNLMRRGVTPTPGQILGGTAQKVESAAESIPLAGQAITRAKGNVVGEFNTAAINDALSPLGTKISAIGHEGMRQAREVVETAYDDALAKMPTVHFDPQFAMAVSNIRNVAQGLVPDRARQFEKILDDELAGRIGGNQPITGEMLHTIESQIKSEARQLGSSQGYDEQKMSQALNEVVREIRDLAARNSPDAAEALKKADSAYARLLRLERAAGSQAAQQSGIFTPTQLGSAIRGMDSSLRKVDIAQNRGLMQGLANDGRDVMGGNLPNSGTADRAMMAALLSGKADLNQLTGMAATAGAYTDPGRKILAAILARRPDASRRAGDYIRRRTPVGALAGAAAAEEAGQ